ncbi:SDR family NAD(P)-dependent oxidoreductase [Gemmobacter denitrificans]|uniref:SDR family oxidoreductase n=1 Tax=Gemmobacter denitrificans TaxID=3123040 RepID=A0ABU8BVK5_9RHOB
MSLSIAGKTAIVTGAANGIGLAIGRHFLDKGANVMFADIDEARLEAEIGAAARSDGPVRMFAGDLRRKLDITNLLSATMDAFERVDILVNASRQMQASDPLCIDDDAVEPMLQQNLMPSLRLTQLTAKRMIAHAERSGEPLQGAIINLSSLAARLTRPELMGYSIACAALEQMTRSMAVVLAPRGIRVNAVAFGSVMSASLQGHLKEHPEDRDAILKGTPLGRIAACSELVETVQFLASDASSFMTGQVVTVDGGRGLLDGVSVSAY